MPFAGTSDSLDSRPSRSCPATQPRRRLECPVYPGRVVSVKPTCVDAVNQADDAVVREMARGMHATGAGDG